MKHACFCLVRIVMPLLIGIHPLIGAEGGLQFFTGDIEALRTAASEERMPYFIYFYAERNAACNKMNERTFVSHTLINFADQRYLPYAVDAAQVPGGLTLAEHYNVMGFPAILIFGPDSEPWDQVYGYVTADDLLTRLQSLREAHKQELPIVIDLSVAEKLAVEQATIVPDLPIHLEPSGTANIHVDNAPVDALIFEPLPTEKEDTLLEISIVVDEVAQRATAISEEEALPVSTSSPGQVLALDPPVFSTPPQHSPMGRHDIAMHLDSLNYGIEIGTFWDPLALEERVVWYERVWHGDIWTYKENVEGKEVFTLILGSYKTEQEADAYAAPIEAIASLSTEVVDFRTLSYH